MKQRTPSEVVLVGGGHAHVQLLRRWMMAPVADARLTLVVDRPDAVYSGMVPGYVAGEYAAHQLTIDLVPLARRAGARLVPSAATRIDPVAKRIAFADRPSLDYDLASLDVGSSVRGLELPGVRAQALATRPIGTFVEHLETTIAALATTGDAPLRLAVVGAGAAGLELGFTLRARIRRLHRECVVTIISETDDLPGYPPAVAARIHAEAAARGIVLRHGARATAVAPGHVRFGDQRLDADLIVWAGGAAAPALIHDSPLPLDPHGFVRVRRTLQVEGHDDLFAAGDCAALVDAPWVRKAGVYAVRQGPVLDANLRARLDGTALRRYRPQREFLQLLNLGDGRALATKWGRVAAGAWVWRVKDRIDRRFVARFQVLDAAGAPAATFPAPATMAGEDMPCGGCAAKVGATPLDAALARLPAPPSDPSVLLGLDRADDVAAFRTGAGDVVVATVDAFRAFTDDPWLVSRIAAVNAASDLYAKGAVPRHALALVTVADDRPARAESTLHHALCGIRAALDPLGVSLIGGHTTTGPEFSVGLAITGDVPAGTTLIGLDGARVGDALVLTKPLGTGVVLAADMRGLATGRWVAAAVECMLRPNADAARIARAYEAHAATDVSGFGLAAHLTSILRASRLDAALDLDRVPALPGARALLERGLRSTAHPQNASAAPLDHAAGSAVRDLLHDPQTSGGLLLVLPAPRAADAVAALHAAGDRAAAVIGHCVAPIAAGGEIRLRTRA